MDGGLNVYSQDGDRHISMTARWRGPYAPPYGSWGHELLRHHQPRHARQHGGYDQGKLVREANA